MRECSPFEIVRELVDLEDLARRFGCDVRRGQICCPSHADRDPSCKVYRDGYHCFACGWRGDAVDFVCLMRGCEPKEALTVLSDMYSLGLDFNITPERRSELKKAREHLQKQRDDADEKRAELLDKYIDICGQIKSINARLDKIPKPSSPVFSAVVGNPELINNIGAIVFHRTKLEREADEIHEELYHMRR